MKIDPVDQFSEEPDPIAIGCSRGWKKEKVKPSRIRLPKTGKAFDLEEQIES